MSTYYEHNHGQGVKFGSSTSYEVVEMTCDAEAVLRLQQDNAALRTTLERVTKERDGWRDQATASAMRVGRLVQSIRALCKEAVL